MNKEEVDGFMYEDESKDDKAVRKINKSRI